MDEYAIWSDDYNFILHVFTQELDLSKVQLAFIVSKDISKEDNLRLIREVTIKKVWQVVKQIGLYLRHR